MYEHELDRGHFSSVEVPELFTEELRRHFCSIRNSEVHTVRDGKRLAAEAYFGWELPHKFLTARTSNQGNVHEVDY
jgi:hypothetical protein